MKNINPKSPCARFQTFIVFFSVLFLLFLAVSPIEAEENQEQAPNFLENFFPSWHIYGSNSMRYDYIIVRGNRNASPYAFQNSQFYNQFGVNFERSSSPYSNWRGQITGVYNDSDYRSSYKDFVPERLNLFFEKGDFFVPFRVEVGDIFAFFTYRTIQLSLKGLRVELQPGYDPARKHSIQLFSGSNQSSWRDYTPENDLSSGISYLVSDPNFGNWSLNLVHNNRPGKSYLGTLGREQFVGSLAGEKQWELFSQQITTELEISSFNGDHDGTAGAQSGLGNDDYGVFFQLTGRARLPLTYRFLFEQYGQDYRPAGGSVSSDRRTIEGHAGWTFSSGLNLRLRGQSYRDSMETVNPTDTHVYGMSLTGPFFKETLNNLSGSINAYFQDLENRDSTTHTHTSTTTANLSKPLYAGWNGRMGFFYQHLNNKIAGSNDSTTVTGNFAIDHSLEFYGLQGSISPGIAIRRMYIVGSDSTELLPTLDINLGRGGHQFALHAGFNNQNRHTLGNPDVGTFDLNANYRYTWKKHTFAVEFFTMDRQPWPGVGTESYKIGCYWTFHFDKPARRARKAAAVPSQPLAESAPLPGSGPVDLSELIPHTHMESVHGRLERGGITGPVEQGRMLLYDTNMLDEIDQRQRLVLIREGGRLEKAALLIDFEDVGSMDNYMRLFARVQEVLLKLYGNPSNSFERGNFGGNLPREVNSERFIRIYEWAVPGGVLRFGIPRRTDGGLRMEIHYSVNFPRIQETMWGLEEVR